MNLSIFQFQAEQSVRVEFQNGEPFFCLSDVTEILGLNRRSTEAFNLKEKGCSKIATPTKGGVQQITYINEPNLYRVIFRSNKPEAVKFQDWIFEEVIPAIRKTGGYQMPHTTPDDRTGLRQAVSAVVGKHRIDYSTAYSLIHQRFNVEHIDELTHEQLGEAVAYCHGLILDGGLWGEVLDAPKVPALQKPELPLDGLDLQRIATSVYYASWAMEILKKTAPAISDLGARREGTTMRTLWGESLNVLRQSREALERTLPHLEDDYADHIRHSFVLLDRMKREFGY